MASTANRLTPIAPIDELPIDFKSTQILNNEAAAAPATCWETFKQAICCCFPIAQQHHHVSRQTVPISSKHLVENYGELISRTANLLTHINQDRQTPLSEAERETLELTTGFIKCHLDELKKMVQHVRYYNDALKLQSSSEGTDELVHSPPMQIDAPKPEFNAEQVEIIKRNGLTEKFAERKIVIGLQEAPFQHPLSQNQIGEIVARVKQQIALLQTGGVNTAFIRCIVNQEVSRYGAKVALPPFLAHIFNAEITEHLQRVKGIEELSTEDCAALVQLIPGYLDINDEAALAHSETSSAD